MNIEQWLNEAARKALPRYPGDMRNFWLGAIGFRNDGPVVSSQNGSSARWEPQIHAEHRLARKLDTGAIVFIARVSRKDRSWVLAKPCHWCLNRLIAVGVKRIYYTIGKDHYGVIKP